MNSILKKAAAVAFAIALGFGARSASAAAVIIDSGQSATVDGWLISAGNGIALSVNVLNGQLVLEKTANFPGLESALVTFNRVGVVGASDDAAAPTSIEFENESITNSNPTQAWSDFEFLLLNTGTPKATFAGTSNVFVPPVGTGVDYTSFTLNAAKNDLVYNGYQGPETISNWGSSNPGDNLLINTNGASNFAFDEVPSAGAVIPLPAAVWQSLVGLLGLGAVALTKKLKHQLA